MKYKSWLILSLVLTATAFLQITSRAAQDLGLAWDANTNAGVAGYYVYYGTNSGVYTAKIDAGTNTFVVMPQLLQGATYYIAVTTYDISGIESVPSPELSVIMPGLVQLTPGTDPGTAATLQFVVLPGYAYEIQASDDLQNWTTLLLTDTQTSNGWFQFEDIPPEGVHPQRFYRTIQH